MPTSIQRVHIPQAAAPSRPSPLVRAGLSSGGQALDKKTERTMSARFGHDFSSVRIHTDARAEDSAEAVGADAFAQGTDIAFGPNKYAPGSRDGERLLAHELTHVVQQERHGPGDPARVSRRADGSEREAEALADQAVAGRSVRVQAAPDAAVARYPGDPFHPETCSVNEPLNMNFNPNAFNPAAGPQATMGPAPQAAGGGDSDGLSPWDVITNNALGTGTSIAEEGLKGTRFAGMGGPFAAFNKIGGPLGMISNLSSWSDDIRSGHFGDAAVDAGAFTGASIGTASTMGLIGEASMLNPVGAAAGAFAGGYAANDWALGKANKYAKNHEIFGTGDDGQARDSTDAAADAGEFVDEKIHSATDWIPGIGHGLGSLIGGPAGAVTAMAGSVGTELYAGGHAAVSGIAHGAGWLKDKIFGEDVDVDMADMNKAQADLNQTMDERAMAEESERLYGGGNQVAHEEMPPLPTR